MDRKYIDDHHVIARYLAGQLSADELEAFESYYVEHPEMMEEMESVALFKLGLMKLRDQGQLASLLRPTPWYTQWRYIAAAVALAVLTLGVTLTFQRIAHRTPLLAASAGALSDSGGRIAIARTYFVEKNRGRPVDTEVWLPAGAQAIELRVLVDFKARPAQYRATLSEIEEDETTQALIAVGGLSMADDGRVVVYLNGERLQEGAYQVAVRGDDGTDAAKSGNVFVIAVRAAEKNNL